MEMVTIDGLIRVLIFALVRMHESGKLLNELLKTNESSSLFYNLFYFIFMPASTRNTLGEFDGLFPGTLFYVVDESFNVNRFEIHRADAIIMGHLWELTLKDDVDEQPYDENGNCKGPLELQPPSPQRLAWDLSNGACLAKINEAYEDGQKLISDLQLRVLIHNRYGKGFMKKCGVSPDAFVQMALQLAYYRDAGRLTLTYEASMTRLFLEGRTETVRTVTMDSAAWVKAMEDGKSTVSLNDLNCSIVIF